MTAKLPESMRWDGTATGATPIIDWILAESAGVARLHNQIVIDAPGCQRIYVLPGDQVVKLPSGEIAIQRAAT
jgi:hypothetical protein